MDEWTGFELSARRRMRFECHEKRLCEGASRIWAVSRRLVERLEPKYGGKLSYVPNGADVEHFERALSMRAPRDGRRPVLCYMGALESWFATKLVDGVARLLPDWTVLLIGPVGLKPDRRAELGAPNIRFTGRVSYESLPGMLAAVDVCMIPFSLNDLVLATSPIKLYEYLAAGLPVVSTSMPEVVPFVENGVVECADTSREFARRAKELAALHRVERRREVARNHSWESRIFEALSEIGEPGEGVVTHR
jgi:glycosyltransferase involved in cell wall biosynthesis